MGSLLCHAPCGGTTHAVGSKGCGTLRGSGPSPFIVRHHSIPPHYHQYHYHHHHYHHYHHYNGDLPLATPRASFGDVTQCDPISVVDPFILLSPSLHTSAAHCSMSFASAPAWEGKFSGRGVTHRPHKAMQSDKRSRGGLREKRVL